jgi:hypothetical protein
MTRRKMRRSFHALSVSPYASRWAREEEHGREPKGPAQLLVARAGVITSARARLFSLRHRKPDGRSAHRGEGRATLPRPSSVVICRFRAALIGTLHDRMVFPSMMTVQLPHCDRPQPKRGLLTQVVAQNVGKYGSGICSDDPCLAVHLERESRHSEPPWLAGRAGPVFTAYRLASSLCR